MNLKSKSVFAAMLAALFVACSPGNGGYEDGVGEGIDGVYYVLNSGDWKSNNSSLTRYGGSVTQFCFESINGRGLGNTANDIIVYGSKMYVAVAGESTIEVADTDAKSIRQIKCDVQPRYLAASGGKVYVSRDFEPSGEAHENIGTDWLSAKFHRIAGCVLNEEKRNRVLDMVLGDEDLSVRQLVDTINSML